MILKNYSRVDNIRSNRGEQYASMNIELVSPDNRAISNANFIKAWRSRITLPAGVEYFSIEKNAFNENAESIRYMNPYPPAYDILFGILHQTNDSVYWTLKFFNALIISLGTQIHGAGSSESTNF